MLASTGARLGTSEDPNLIILNGNCSLALALSCMAGPALFVTVQPVDAKGPKAGCSSAGSCCCALLLGPAAGLCCWALLLGAQQLGREFPSLYLCHVEVAHLRLLRPSATRCTPWC